MDKLDGKINLPFYERKAAEWEAERERLMALIGGHQRAESAYFREGVELLELASRARELFQSQEPAEKRKLLNFVLSNSSWRDGRLTASYRRPFDLISETAVEAAELAQTEPFKVVTGWFLRTGGGSGIRTPVAFTTTVLRTPDAQGHVVRQLPLAPRSAPLTGTIGDVTSSPTYIEPAHLPAVRNAIVAASAGGVSA